MPLANLRALARAYSEAPTQITHDSANSTIEANDFPPDADMPFPTNAGWTDHAALLPRPIDAGSADDEPPAMPIVRPPIPFDALVEELAELMAANPAHRVLNRVRAMESFRGMARNRLAGSTDPVARGLLLSWERQRAERGKNG